MRRCPGWGRWHRELSPLSRGAGACARGGGLAQSRPLPAPLTRRASGPQPLPAASGQPGLARPQDARVQPRSGAPWPAGRGAPGALRPPWGPNRRPDPERPERRSPPSPAALTRPRRRPGSRPSPGRSSRFKPRARTSPAGLHHRAAAHGGDARRSLRPREARRPAAPVPARHPARGGAQIPRDPLGAPGGVGVTRGEARRRGRPPGPGDGRRGHRRLRVARAVGCAQSPPFGRRLVSGGGTAAGAGRGHPAAGAMAEPRTQEPETRVTSATLRLISGGRPLFGAHRAGVSAGSERRRGCRLGGEGALAGFP